MCYGCIVEGVDGRCDGVVAAVDNEKIASRGGEQGWVIGGPPREPVLYNLAKVPALQSENRCLVVGLHDLVNVSAVGENLILPQEQEQMMFAHTSERGMQPR
jgi:hypothetical protein